MTGTYQAGEEGTGPAKRKRLHLITWGCQMNVYDSARMADFPAEDKFDFLPDAASPPGLTAFLTIQEGCDKFCSFCVVPYTRGAEASRPAAAVIAEARRLVAQGAKEITLLGQNVNAWHGEGLDGTDWRLGRLIFALAEIPGLLRLRYT